MAARTEPGHLVNAIPQLFRSLELLLKAKLQTIAPTALAGQPNNPTVLKRLATAGVTILEHEKETITRLRSLRNKLQHGTAKFNYRTGLSVARRAIVLIDRFSEGELGLWIGDAIPMEEWGQLLKISDIAKTARRVVDKRLSEIRKDQAAIVSTCPRCETESLIRPHPRTGAACLYCGCVPVYQGES